MAMTKLHGQSEYTSTKQDHLSGILSYCRNAWNLSNKAEWAHDELIVVDCTSGAGYDEQGHRGSPLIFYDYLKQTNYGKFRLLCCEVDSKRAGKLTNTVLGSDPRVTIANDQFQNVIADWLAGIPLQKRSHKLLGWVYCDPNGAKDLIGNFDVFNKISYHWERLDFIFHFSLTAYNRNRGVGADWASAEVVEQCDRLRYLKKYGKARLPRGKWNWVLFHLLNTDKVDGRWDGEEIMPYEEWRQQVFAPTQRSLFDG